MHDKCDELKTLEEWNKFFKALRKSKQYHKKLQRELAKIFKENRKRLKKEDEQLPLPKDNPDYAKLVEKEKFRRLKEGSK